MHLDELEKSFNRALVLAFSKKKFLLTFPILVLCGVLVVFCRAIAFNASGWIVMSLIFLSIFLSSGILLSLGVLLIRIYYHEVKNLRVHYKTILKRSWELIIGSSYLSMPILLSYLFLWVIFGLFMFFKELPYVGQAIAVVLAFAPFLIILISILLCIVNLALLFFVTPSIAFKSDGKLNISHILSKIPKNILSSIIFLFFGLFPLVVTVAILTLAAVLTGMSYFIANHNLSITLQWFFIMVPYCALLTPSLIFFFNFAAESYNWLNKRD
ncbi:MAG: hypothetical protein HZB76_04630 [Chlamydiae bacterium]|nr:hypothetical protein [Chlamydiota bacterium]